MYSQTGPQIMMALESRMIFIFRVQNPIYLERMPFWYLLGTRYHSNIGVQLRPPTELDTSTLY